MKYKGLTAILILCVILAQTIQPVKVKAAGHVHTDDCYTVCGSKTVRMVLTFGTDGNANQTAYIHLFCADCGYDLHGVGFSPVYSNNQSLTMNLQTGYGTPGEKWLSPPKLHST